MDGPQGASSEHAREKPEHAFRTAEDVLRVLAGKSSAAPVDPYWHVGENPTVDVVLTRKSPGRGTLEILLIRRDEDAPAEPGKWALPGGFVATDAPRGAPWLPGAETERETAMRELREETGLDLSAQAFRLIHVGDYVGGGRDPRDTPEAWSRSTVFALHLEPGQLSRWRSWALPSGARAREGLETLPGFPLQSPGIAGHDDAAEAAWVEVDRLPLLPLAFDHARIVADALACLGETVKTPEAT
jgi:ADP-ribose pyrophosphatase YjhB (NUDIX family)